MYLCGIEIALNLPSNYVDSASNWNKYQESSSGKARPVRKADNLTAICELIV
jgi:hypothetical protein